MKNIFDLDWVKVWTTEYSLFSCWLYGHGYVHFCKKELGYGFDNIVINMKEKLATVWRPQNQIDNFCKCLAAKSLQDINFGNSIVNKLQNVMQNLDKLMDLSVEKFLTSENLNEFISLHKTFLPYFLAPLWIPNALNEHRKLSDNKKKLFELFADARKKSETYPLKLEIFLQKLYKFIGEKERINNLLLRALLPSELEEYVHNGILPSVDILKERFEFCVVRVDVDKTYFMLGKEAKLFIHKLSHFDGKNTSEIVGITAHKGLIRGNVKIIFHTDELHEIKKGNVLVTTMTRPEWLSAMKKASAFVTDAGGVLCHAAIVARELNKPCIIATKHATQILKDGDLVEVNANKGTVKIIEKS